MLFRLQEQLDAIRWLAVDDNDRPAMVFRIDRTGESVARRLRYLHYTPPTPMRLVANGIEQVVTAAVLLCLAEDAALREQFLPLAQAMCSFDGETVTESALEHRLDAFVELLAALTQPPKQTAQGLWAELAFIAWAPDAVTAAEAWHDDIRALHDFSHGEKKVEVKSTVETTREHSVGLDQLDESKGNEVIVASFVLLEDSDGISVDDLLQHVLERLAARTDLQRKIRSVVSRSLGRQVMDAGSVRIDAGHAQRNLRYFRARDVPSVATPLHEAVSQVHFRVDLTDVDTPSVDALRSAGEWWERVLRS